MQKNKVLQSYNLAGDLRCVDVFRRHDGTFGFEEYRREPEDGRGWFVVGHHGERRFDSTAEALAEAKVRVSWLTAAIAGR